MPEKYDDPRLSNIAKQQLRLVLNLSENVPVPLGFHLKAKVEQLNEQIKRLPVIPYPSPEVLLGSYILGTSPEKQIKKHKQAHASRIQLEAVRDKLVLALPWAKEREKYDKALRSRVVNTFYKELKSGLLKAAKQEINLRVNLHIFFIRPQADGGGYPLSYIVADIRVKVPVEKKVGWKPAGPAGAIPKFRQVMEWRGEPAAIFYIDWERQKIGTKARPKEVEKDFFYWLKKVSEGILLATDVITVVGLVRRAAVKALGKLSIKVGQKVNSLLEKQITKALDDAIKGLERESKRATSFGARKPPFSVGEKVAKEQVEKRAAQETTKASKSERATDRPKSGRQTVADRRASVAAKAEEREGELFERLEAIHSDRKALNEEIKLNEKRLKHAKRNREDIKPYLRRRKELKEESMRLKNEGEFIGNQIKELRHIKRISDAKYIDELTKAAQSRTEYKELLDNFGGLDEVFGTSLSRSEATVEHIVPRSRIASLKGFEKLNWSDQVNMFLYRRNLKVISRSANSARQDKAYSRWEEFSRFVKQGTSPKEIRKLKKKMMDLEKKLEAELQAEIDKILRVTRTY